VLEGKGYISADSTKSRSLELAPKFLQEQRRLRPAGVEIPLLGRIGGGLAGRIRGTTGSAELRGILLAAATTYALEVRGDFHDRRPHLRRDLILLERVAEVHDGDIVGGAGGRAPKAPEAGFTGQSVDTVRLQPANAALQPIIVPARDVEIQGRLGGARKYK